MPDETTPESERCESRYRLDPARFPRTLELEISEEAFQTLQALSQRSGRTIGDVAAQIFGSLPEDRLSEF